VGLSCQQASILELGQETQPEKTSIYWNSIRNPAMPPFQAKVVFILARCHYTAIF